MTAVLERTDVALRPCAGPQRWDSAVAAHPDGTPFHLSGFLQTAGNVLGLRVHLTELTVGGEPVGLVPLLVRAHGPLVSVNHGLPFPYLGPLLPPGYPMASVLPAVRRYLRPLSLLHFGLQSPVPFSAATWPGWQVDDGYESAILPVAALDDDQLIARMVSQRRTQLRKLLRSGVQVVPATREEIAESLSRWAEATFRRQGLAPRWPRGAHAAFFDALIPSGVALPSVVRDGDEVLLVALDLTLGRRTVAWEVGISEAGRAKSANVLLIYELMRAARDRGAVELDLLGPVNEGMASFKRSMGAEFRPRGAARWTSPVVPLARRLLPQRPRGFGGAAS